MFGYRVPDPDEVMLVSGRKAAEDTPFRIYRQGKFIVPGFLPFGRVVKMLSLGQQQANVTEACTTTQGLNVNVEAVIAFKIAPDDGSIYAAGQRFLDDQRQDRSGNTVMAQQTGQIFAGHLRSIVGAMTLEQMIKERQELATQVLDASKVEMVAMGLMVDSFQIRHVDDGDSGYIKAMAAPHNAAIQQEAQMAQSKANQAAAEVEQESQRKQAEYQRQTMVVQAAYKAEVDKAQAEAGQSGPLAQAEAQRKVLEMQTELAQRQANLREQQLQAEIVKPAQAEAERVAILAKADADKMELQAAAAASSNRISLDRMLIDQLPQIVREVAQGLAGSKLTVLNGAEGLNEMATSLTSQGFAIFNALRSGLDDQTVSAEAGSRAPNNAQALTGSGSK